MNGNVPPTNIMQVKEDRKRLKHKGIKSPDLNRMTYFIHDKKLRATYFFHTKEKYAAHYQRLIKESPPENFIVSHPRLCKKNTKTI